MRAKRARQCGPADDFALAGLDCDPSAFSSETSAHRGISPAPPRASPPPPRTRRTSSNGRPNGDAGLLSQTRPAGPRAPSASPPQPTVNLPAAATAVMRPPPPRRGSSGSFSYAAALRGDGSPTASEAPSLSSPSSSPSASSSSSTPAPSVPTPPAPTDLPTPKHELESAFASLPASDAPAPAVHLPTLWQAIANSPQLPSLAPLHPPPAASPPADEAEWPAPSSPPARPGGPMMRRMSSDVASVLAKTRRGRAGGGAGGRRKSLVEQPAVDEDEGALDDRGLRSWTDATISGVRRLVLSSFSAGQSLTAQRSCAQFCTSWLHFESSHRRLLTPLAAHRLPPQRVTLPGAEPALRLCVAGRQFQLWLPLTNLARPFLYRRASPSLARWDLTCRLAVCSFHFLPMLPALPSVSSYLSSHKGPCRTRLPTSKQTAVNLSSVPSRLSKSS